jgi:hypothetical protein
MADEDDSEAEGFRQCLVIPDPVPRGRAAPWQTHLTLQDVRIEHLERFLPAAEQLAQRAGVEREVTRLWLLERCERGEFALFWIPPGHYLPKPTYPRTFPFYDGVDEVGRSRLLVLRDEIDKAGAYLREYIEGPSQAGEAEPGPTSYRDKRKGVGGRPTLHPWEELAVGLAIWRMSNPRSLPTDTNELQSTFEEIAALLEVELPDWRQVSPRIARWCEAYDRYLANERAHES